MTWSFPVEYEPGQANGDLVYLVVSNGKTELTSVPAGSTGQVLGFVGGVPAWTASPAISGDQTITGALTVTGWSSLTGGLSTGALVETGTGSTLTVAKSGHLITCSAATDAASNYILPAANVAGGMTFSFVLAASALGSNRELRVNTPAGSDLIIGTTLATAGAGIATTAGASHGVKNTHATAVRGDHVSLMSDGVNTWYMTSLAGIWAAF
jgi:hypothetical protein